MKKLISTTLLGLFLTSPVLGAFSDAPENQLIPERDNQPPSDRKRMPSKGEVYFSYDYSNEVAKCTTISPFNNENALGTFNAHTGIVSWDKDRMAEWYADMQPDYCKRCVWFPACNGSCNRQIMAHKGEQICTFGAMNLTRKEYLMYLFKNSILEKELTGIQLNI